MPQPIAHDRENAMSGSWNLTHLASGAWHGTFLLHYAHLDPAQTTAILAYLRTYGVPVTITHTMDGHVDLTGTVNLDVPTGVEMAAAELHFVHLLEDLTRVPLDLAAGAALAIGKGKV